MKNPFAVVYTLFQVLVLWVTISDRPLLLVSISFYSPYRSSGMFQNILLAEYHGTFHDSFQQKDSFSLTLKTSFSEEEMTLTIYVCS